MQKIVIFVVSVNMQNRNLRVYYTLHPFDCPSHLLFTLCFLQMSTEYALGIVLANNAFVIHF